MKKTTVLILALLLFTMTVVGCDNRLDTDPSTTANVTETSTVPEVKAISRGVWNGNIYTNSSVGIEITAPENWDIFTDSQIDLQTGSTNSSYLDGENYKPEVVNQPNFSDLMIYNSDVNSGSYTSNITLMFSTIEDSGIAEDMTTEQYFTIMKQTLTSESNKLGFTMTFDDHYADYKIGDYDYKILNVSTLANGVEGSQMYIARKHGNRIMCLLMSYTGDLTKEEMLGYIK